MTSIRTSSRIFGTGTTGTKRKADDAAANAAEELPHKKSKADDAAANSAEELPHKKSKADDAAKAPEQASEASDVVPQEVLEAAPSEVFRYKLQGYSFNYYGNYTWSRDKEDHKRIWLNESDPPFVQGNDVVFKLYACNVPVYFRCSSYQDCTYNDCSDLRLLFSKYGTNNHRLAKRFADHINGLFEGIFKVEIVRGTRIKKK